MDIPMYADVYCGDDLYGRSTRVILNPQTKNVTHLVVREENRPFTERIVPIGRVAETGPAEIRLACSGDTVRQEALFTITEYILEEATDYRDTNLKLWPYEQPNPYMPHRERYMKVQYERIPPGELALRRGARVKAADGMVGHVQAFLVDPESGHITHLVLRTGHLWRQQDIPIAMSTVERIEGQTVYVNLAKSDINKLPAVQV